MPNEQQRSQQQPTVEILGQPSLYFSTCEWEIQTLEGRELKISFHMQSQLKMLSSE